jgi:hypothetical protein
MMDSTTMLSSGDSVTPNNSLFDLWSVSCPFTLPSFWSLEISSDSLDSKRGWTGLLRIGRISLCEISRTSKVSWTLSGQSAEHRADDVEKGKGDRKLLALASKERLIRILEKMLDEKEFLSDYGVRS